MVYLVTWANLWAPSWALPSFLSPSLPISPVLESLCPAPSCPTPAQASTSTVLSCLDLCPSLASWPPVSLPPAHLSCPERGLTVPELALLRTCSEPQWLPPPLTRSQPLNSSVALMTSSASSAMLQPHNSPQICWALLCTMSLYWLSPLPLIP